MRQGAVRIRLDVNDAEAGVLFRAAGARRFAYNWAVAKINENSKEWAARRDAGVDEADRVRPLSFFTLAKVWTAEKPELAPWSADHSTWTFRYAIRSAVEAHQAFLAGRRRFPKFKSRHRDRPRFTVADGLHLEAGRVRLAKYGWMKIAAPCQAQADLRRLVRRGRARLLNITVSRPADGHWYATVCFERTHVTTEAERMAPPGPTVGVDRGIRTNAVAATAEGVAVAELGGLRPRRDAQRRLARRQRAFSRTKKGSKNRRKAAARLAKLHHHVAAVRADHLHAFTARLAREHSVVVVEDLATKNMLANHTLAGAIADQGWAELARQLAYKTARHGGLLITADRWFASSKTCSCCGWVKPKLGLSERTYTCGNPTCRSVLDRDVNAAINLAAWGDRSILQDGDRHPGGPPAGTCRHACGGSNEPTRTTVGSAGASVETGTSRPPARVA